MSEGEASVWRRFRTCDRGQRDPFATTEPRPTLSPLIRAQNPQATAVKQSLRFLPAESTIRERSRVQAVHYASQPAVTPQKARQCFSYPNRATLSFIPSPSAAVSYSAEHRTVTFVHFRESPKHCTLHLSEVIVYLTPPVTRVVAGSQEQTCREDKKKLK